MPSYLHTILNKAIEIKEVAVCSPNELQGKYSKSTAVYRVYPHRHKIKNHLKKPIWTNWKRKKHKQSPVEIFLPVTVFLQNKYPPA